jgi:hypothetical protein
VMASGGSREDAKKFLSPVIKFSSLLGTRPSYLIFQLNQPATLPPPPFQVDVFLIWTLSKARLLYWLSVTSYVPDLNLRSGSVIFVNGFGHPGPCQNLAYPGPLLLASVSSVIATIPPLHSMYRYRRGSDLSTYVLGGRCKKVFFMILQIRDYRYGSEAVSCPLQYNLLPYLLLLDFLFQKNGFVFQFDRWPQINEHFTL